MANEYLATVKNGSPVATPGTGAETVVLAQSPQPPVVYNNPGGAGNLIEGTLYITNGTGTTGVTIQCRQQTLTGAVVDTTGVIPLAAGVRGAIPFTFVDNSALATNSPGGLVYVITLTGTGTTGAGSVYGSMEITAGTTAS